MGRRRAVITGVGAVSAFGVGYDALANGLAAGRSAIGPIRNFDARTFPTRVAGEVPIEKTSASLLEKHRGVLLHIGEAAAWEHSGLLRDRKVCFGLIAAAEAWRHARCGTAERRAALSIGLGLEQAFLEDFADQLDGDEIRIGAGDLAGPEGVRFRSRVDLTAEKIRGVLGLSGRVAVHVSACAAGGTAVAHAASLIERGAADVVLCGAADSMVNPLGIGGMSRLGAPSPRAEPSACRPFDRRRDGLVVGEGAAMFVVEEEGRARARGADLLAVLAGSATTQDAYRATAPRPDGSRAHAAMERAVRRANLAPSDIGYVNAHGTGTPLNDMAEAKAIRALFGDVPTSSIKGAVGHLMAAAGAIELAACLLAFMRDLLPGTAHFEEPDPECPIHVIGPQPLKKRVDHVLSNSFGFGGQNVSVVLGRPR
ncbi:beta-ketoacyl-[acyl-carrier-protein] synthase family protein [Polyangium sorediatum]|uniref:Beta-ketoacyl-[acyl-carrier-protein] synthase family protein n=1 Tax=Polyangium sorediatum TaxID=889274 RepID=A0ABT6NVJ5_9BACT|nr:beta-ketoacyl-[acyl-carrier-protein] synthase family protein [Polyangium sorediatum]MDI1432338.1 beta-ketoacyl-[acyl-carrier-protein] synthase family protein [Polyangium sorediatum]